MIWLSTKEVAELLQVNERTVRRNIEKYEYRHINGAGGKQGQLYQIALESLPEDAQARHHGQQLEADGQAERELLELTDAQREVFFAKLAAVRSYKEFKASYPKADKMTAFLQQYNIAHPDKPLNKNKLNHWEKLYDREGIPGLIDRRGTWNKGISSIPEDVKKVFLAYWLQEKGTRDGGPSVASCYRLTQMNFPGMQLPSMSTFERLTLNLPAAVKALNSVVNGY